MFTNPSLAAPRAPVPRLPRTGILTYPKTSPSMRAATSGRRMKTTIVSRNSPPPALVNSQIPAWLPFGPCTATRNGHFNGERIAFDSSGNVWVSDHDNNRVEEFSATGTYEMQIGCAGTGACSGGSGAGQFNSPGGVAIAGEAGATSGGTIQANLANIWVVDYGNNRVGGFSPTGTYEGQFGSFGSGNGKLDNPRASPSTPAAISGRRTLPTTAWKNSRPPAPTRGSSERPVAVMGISTNLKTSVLTQVVTFG